MKRWFWYYYCVYSIIDVPLPDFLGIELKGGRFAMRIMKSILATTLSLVLISGTAQATVLVSDLTYNGGQLDLSGPHMDSFRGLLDTATGGDFAYTTDMSNAAQVASADALMIQPE